MNWMIAIYIFGTVVGCIAIWRADVTNDEKARMLQLAFLWPVVALFIAVAIPAVLFGWPQTYDGLDAEGDPTPIATDDENA